MGILGAESCLRRIYTTGHRNTDDPDVTWEGEFADAASLNCYEEIADKNPDFLAARQKMGTLTRKTERRYWEIRLTRA